MFCSVDRWLILKVVLGGALRCLSAIEALASVLSLFAGALSLLRTTVRYVVGLGW